MTDAGPSLGVLIGVPIIAVLLLVSLSFIIAGLRLPNDIGLPMVVLATVFMVVTTVIAGFTMWPWAPSFHQWYRVHGTVQETGSRQISDGKTMSTRFVFRINGQPYGVDDTRAALTKVGDVVDLMCKKEYVFRSQPGWACNWND